MWKLDILNGAVLEFDSLESAIDAMREDFPDVVAFQNGFEVLEDDDANQTDTILLWETEVQSLGDDGSRAVAKITWQDKVSLPKNYRD